MNNEEITKKLEEQDKVLQELLVQSTRSYKVLNWLRIIAVIKLLVIVAPIILAIIYLPPFVKTAIEKYGNAIPGIQEMMK